MALDFRLHPLPSAALPRGHAALAFLDVGVGFVDRATIETKRTKTHRTTEEEMEGPILF
jgi:hypothetical protein